MSGSTGVDRISICASASHYVWPDHVCNAAIRMDCSQVLLVLLHLVYQLAHLHFLRYDDGGSHSELHPGLHCERLLLHALQPFHWILDSTTGTQKNSNVT